MNSLVQHEVLMHLRLHDLLRVQLLSVFDDVVFVHELVSEVLLIVNLLLSVLLHIQYVSLPLILVDGLL